MSKKRVIDKKEFNGSWPGEFFDRKELSLVEEAVPELATDEQYIKYASALTKILGVIKIYRARKNDDCVNALSPAGSARTLSANNMIRALEGLYSKAFSNFTAGVEAAAQNTSQALAIRIMKAFSLGRVEIEALNAVSAGLFDGVRHNCFKLHYTLKELADHLNLDPASALYLVSDSCGLVKARIYESGQEQYADNLFEKHSILPSVECLKALHGFELSCAERLKLEGMPVAGLIASEKKSAAGAQLPDASKIQATGSELEKPLPQQGPSDITPEEADELIGMLEDGDDDDDDTETGESEFYSASGENGLRPYENDIEYIKDRFGWLDARSRAFRKKHRGLGRDKTAAGAVEINELAGREKMMFNKVRRRLELTRTRGAFWPKFERYSEMYGLNDDERLIFLCALYFIYKNDDPRADQILDFICADFDDRVKISRYLYGASNLVKSGLINIEEEYRRRSARFELEIDRHLYNEIIGLKLDVNEILNGSNLYRPATKFEEVILPDEIKVTVKKTVENLSAMQALIKKTPSGGVDYYGTGSIMLFYGPSGTGKTMLANAIANYMNKNLLLINFSQLDRRGDVALRAIFRDAKINDAIVFFDECDAILSDRHYNSEFASVMTELERHDGFAILATNEPEHIDEAARRRVMLSIEFRKPDYNMREKIWRREVPERVRKDPDIDWHALAFNYELTGGLIKNAVRTAILSSLERNAEDPVLTNADLEAAAKSQLKCNFSSSKLKNLIAPSVGLEKFIAPAGVIETLKDVIKSEKNKNILFGQWGFGKDEGDQRGYGTTLLLYGAPGTGKTYCTEVLGYELGKPVMKVNLAHILSCWVGETGKNIQQIFADALASDAILLFDEADALFAGRGGVRSATDRYANSDVNIILQEIENYKGVAVLTTNLIDNLDAALFRRIKYTIKFDTPDAALREKLWYSLIPEQTPISADIDFRRIAEKYETSGAVIKKAIFAAAGIAAGRCAEAGVMITEADICRALEREYIPGAGGVRKIGFDAAA